MSGLVDVVQNLVRSCQAALHAFPVLFQSWKVLPPSRRYKVKTMTKIPKLNNSQRAAS